MATLAEPTPTDNRAAALDLAARGLHVFPLQPGTKHPYPGTHGYHDATTDKTTIVAWWTANPRANIGVACAASSLAVVDIDPRNGGDLDDVGPVPDTWTVETGGGGWHLYFRYTGTALLGKLGQGIDVKHNGYVVAPPSIHPSGRCYCWQIGAGPDDVPLAALPPSLAARAADRLRVGCTLHSDGAVLQIASGERNQMLFRLGALLRRYGVAHPALAECLAALNRYHVAEPLSEIEVARIAASCCRYLAGIRP